MFDNINIHSFPLVQRTTMKNKLTFFETMKFHSFSGHVLASEAKFKVKLSTQKQKK